MYVDVGGHVVGAVRILCCCLTFRVLWLCCPLQACAWSWSARMWVLRGGWGGVLGVREEVHVCAWESGVSVAVVLLLHACLGGGVSTQKVCVCHRVYGVCCYCTHCLLRTCIHSEAECFLHCGWLHAGAVSLWMLPALLLKLRPGWVDCHTTRPVGLCGVVQSLCCAVLCWGLSRDRVGVRSLRAATSSAVRPCFRITESVMHLCQHPANVLKVS